MDNTSASRPKNLQSTFNVKKLLKNVSIFSCAVFVIPVTLSGCEEVRGKSQYIKKMLIFCLSELSMSDKKNTNDIRRASSGNSPLSYT
jgi:hypothetical protein